MRCLNQVDSETGGAPSVDWGRSASRVGPGRLARLRFLYQLTHLTRDRGALTHDDRVDAVAGAVAHFQRAMMMDVDQAAKALRDEEMLQEIEDRLPRHAGQWGPGANLVEPEGHEWSVKNPLGTTTKAAGQGAAALPRRPHR